MKIHASKPRRIRWQFSFKVLRWDVDVKFWRWRKKIKIVDHGPVLNHGVVDEALNPPKQFFSDVSSEAND